MSRWMDIMRSPVVCAALGLWLLSGVDTARSQAVVTKGDTLIQVSLLPGRAEADGARMAGLVFDVVPGWKTYWRNPGAAGIPPRFDWSRSSNLGSAEIFWPQPKIFESFGMTTLGYSGRTVLPVRFLPERPDKPMEIGLDLFLGVCREICVLVDTSVDASIAPDAPENGGAQVAAAEAAVTRSGAEMGLTGATCRIRGAGNKRGFEATLDFAESFPSSKWDPMVVLEGPELTWFTGIETAIEPDVAPGDRLSVAAALSLLDETIWVDRSEIRMTVLAGGLAADIQGCTAPAG
jgi:DsbC/DsbD-like thiol-disulfide interchange protein